MATLDDSALSNMTLQDLMDRDTVQDIETEGEPDQIGPAGPDEVAEPGPTGPIEQDTLLAKLTVILLAPAFLAIGGLMMGLSESKRILISLFSR